MRHTRTQAHVATALLDSLFLCLCEIACTLLILYFFFSLFCLYLCCLLVFSVSNSQLFTCLQDHCTLHTLQLRSNRISCEGGQALGALLRASRSLEHVDLRMNFLAEEGGQAVASAVAFAPCLTHLNLQSE